MIGETKRGFNWMLVFWVIIGFLVVAYFVQS